MTDVAGGMESGRTEPVRSGKVFARWALLWMLTMPVVAESVPPELVHEESLSGQELVGKQPLLSVGLARRLMNGGSARLVLRVADEVLEQGGAPLAVVDWLRLKAEALLAVEQFAAARDFLQEMPTEALGAYPDLHLLLAASHRELGCCGEARRLYGTFLLANPQHPKRFQAQLGIGLCALEQDLLEEAELQLRLYEQEPDRPKQDPLLQIGLAELARRRGMTEEENGLMSQVAESAAPAEPLARRARLMALANWEARQQHWNTAISWLESGLRQEGPLPRLLRLHTHWLQQWLGSSATAAPTGEHRQLAEPLRRGAEQRMNGLRALLRPGEKAAQSGGAQRVAQLELLLRQEAQERLGLLEEGGVLRPDLLWPTGELPAEYRLAYAEFYRGRGDRERAWALLEGLTGLEADGQRLLLLASCAETGVEEIDAVLDRLAKGTEWPEAVKSRTIKALFILTTQGRQAPVTRLRELLAAALPQTRDVQRALAFHQARVWALEGDADRALVEWLNLAFAPHNKQEENRYLPEDPRLAAARVLEEQGWPAAAAELRRF
ncbi:MAG: hypothetical protein H7837_09295 [Magnetococcus sp. MYC-9]